MNSGGGDQTTTQEPWPPLGEMLRFGFDEARGLYDQGNLAPEFFPGQTFAPFDPNQLQAQQGITNFVRSPGMQQLLGGSMQGISNMQSGLDPRVNPLLQQTIPLLSGANTATNFGMMGATDPRFNPFLNQAMQGAGQSGQTLSRIQSGGMNPMIDALVNQGQRDIVRGLERQALPESRAQAQAAGQAGSSRHGIVEGMQRGRALEEMGDLSTNLRARLFESGEDRALQAAQAGLQGLGTAFGQGLNAQQNAAGNVFDMLGQGADMGFTAIGRGTALAPQVQEMPFRAFDALNSVGQQRQQQTQQGINELMQRYQQNSTRDLTALQNMFSFLGGSGAQGFGQTTTPGPESNRFSNAAGGALSGLAATGGNPLGAVVGGLLGLFSGG